MVAMDMTREELGSMGAEGCSGLGPCALEAWRELDTWLFTSLLGPLPIPGPPKGCFLASP